MIHLDTHVIVWLVIGDLARISSKAKQKIEFAELHISPIVLLEIEYLFEIGKVKHNARKFEEVIENDLGIQIADSNYLSIVRSSYREKWTRDPFDRMIVAHARMENAELVSGDRLVLEKYGKCVW